MMFMQVCILPHFLPMNNACPMQLESKIRKKNAKHLIVCIKYKNETAVLDNISLEMKAVTRLILYQKNTRSNNFPHLSLVMFFPVIHSQSCSNK